MPIMEQGYQHWSGDVSGHTWRWLAIARHGIRIQFRNRFLRYVLFAAWMPALILVGMLAIWGMLERKSNLVSTFVAFMRFMNPSVIADPRYYRVEIWRLSYGYFMHVELFFSLLIALPVPTEKRHAESAVPAAIDARNTPTAAVDNASAPEHRSRRC